MTAASASAAIPSSTPAATESAATWARRSTSPGRSPTSAISRACIASRKAARARRSGRARRSPGHSASSSSSWTSEVPYLSFSGGEPMVHPHFFEMVDYVCSRGGELKIETNGHFLTPDNCARLQRARRQGRAGEPRRRDPRDVQQDARARRVRHRRRRHAQPHEPPAFRSRSTTRRRTSTSTKSARAVDLAYELGAYSFYTGRTMYTGNAVKTWHQLAPDEEQYDAFFETLHAKSEEYRGRMRVYFHEMGLLEELRYRLHHPAALLIVLPNGLVKLINALPFICGDLRQQSLASVWANFQRAWQDPRVAQFVDDLAHDPQKTRRCTNGSISDRAAARRGSAPGIAVTADPVARREPASATASSSTPVCCRTCWARRGRTRSQRRFDAPIFWSGLAGVVLAVDRRRDLQRILRLADGHRPRVQSERPAADVRRRLLARRRGVRRARSRSGCTSTLPRRLADPRLRGAGRALPRSSMWRRRFAGRTAAWARP